MKRLIPSGSRFRIFCLAAFAAVAFLCVTAPRALAQHAGGHMGGAGHVSIPPAAHPAASRPVTPMRPMAPVRPPLVVPGPRSFLIRPPVNEVVPQRGLVVGYPFRNPIQPRRPIFPFRPFGPFGRVGFFPPGFGVFGIPFFGLGYGWGFGPGWWAGCDPFWGLSYGCAGVAPYEYSPSYTLPSVQPGYTGQFQVQSWPVYYNGEENSQYVQLYLNDGTIYNVTDYWLVNGVLHFKTLEESGTKVVEHTIDFGQLDLQKTIDVDTARGFRFVLRNEPLEQYLRDHPPSDSPDDTAPQNPPDNTPAEPAPAGLQQPRLQQAPQP